MGRTNKNKKKYLENAIKLVEIKSRQAMLTLRKQNTDKVPWFIKPNDGVCEIPDLTILSVGNYKKLVIAFNIL